MKEGGPLTSRVLLTAILAAALSSTADAHFVLVSPAASLVQNRLGDPQKQAPCGGVSANPGRGTAANPGAPSLATTQVTGGSSLHLLLQETVFHPGHYRVSLARTVGQLPADPVVTTRDSERGPWSVSAAIQTTHSHRCWLTGSLLTRNVRPGCGKPMSRFPTSTAPTA